MTERPILFGAPMVRAILDGRKTQTRRVIKSFAGSREPLKNLREHGASGEDVSGAFNDPMSWGRPYGEDSAVDISLGGWPEIYPYQPGDRLWVKETWCPANSDIGPVVLYRADGHRWQPDYDGKDYGAGPSFDYDKYPAGKHAWTAWAPEVEAGTHKAWQPSIFMPRWASRITLEVTGVRPERLQDISGADALAEGIHVTNLNSISGWGVDGVDIQGNTPAHAYSHLWDHINGAGSWDANPWVWVIAFRRVA